MRLPLFSRKKQSKDTSSSDMTYGEEITYYPVCPTCLSPQLSKTSSITGGWLTPASYYCPRCGYSGRLFLEIDIRLLETKTPEEIRELMMSEEE